jgi:hypothetical protein
MTMALHRPRAAIKDRGVTSKDAADASSTSQSLHDEAQMILDEARMVLPGIQALFGFQLIAVFTEGFRRLTDVERLAHLGSLLLVTVAIALIMTPAAYDRIVGEQRVSRRFITLASRVITSAMVPLMLGIALETYVVSLTVIGDPRPATGVAVAVALLFAALWFALPWLRRMRSSA